MGTATKEQDLTQGVDIRGDEAAFIEEKHFKNDWELDDEAKAALGSGVYFFRVVRNGEQQSGHGWIENGEIIQWG